MTYLRSVRYAHTQVNTKLTWKPTLLASTVEYSPFHVQCASTGHLQRSLSKSTCVSTLGKSLTSVNFALTEQLITIALNCIIIFIRLKNLTDVRNALIEQPRKSLFLNIWRFMGTGIFWSECLSNYCSYRKYCGFLVLKWIWFVSAIFQFKKSIN